ncbi:MAG: hypothetical protein AAF627_14100 [Myxococcota bacterium]
MLSEGEQKRVSEAVAAVEERTAGEIVVQVVAASDAYAGPRLWAAVLAGAGLAEAVLLLVPSLSSQYDLLIAAAASLSLWWVSAWPSVLRFVVSKEQRATAVHRRAKEAFLDAAVFRTRDRSGVLILVSMLEHKVEILADDGIHARMGVDGWTQHVRSIVEGVRSGSLTAGLEKAIAGIGEELAAAFPPRPDDVDELPNAPIVDT